MKIRQMNYVTLMLATMGGLTACGDTLEKLESVGKQPPMAQIENPTDKPDYQPVSWPMPQAQVPQERGLNSLWQPGAKAFFRDQRAREVGDILTVTILIDEEAQLDNTTQRARNSQDQMGAPGLFGLERKLTDAIAEGTDLNNLLGVNSNHSTTGQGRIIRRERIGTTLAAMVTQILPNGNMVIAGKQQVRINYELREVGISGVVRPEDINSDNSIPHTKVAEARVVYGGKGTLSDIQTPRYGTQIIDILSPF